MKKMSPVSANWLLSSLSNKLKKVDNELETPCIIKRKGLIFKIFQNKLGLRSSDQIKIATP